MKYKTPVNGIEEQLKKLFGSLGSSWVKVSFILSKLDISKISNSIQQRESTYSIESLLKLYLYKRVKGITTHPNLIKDLTKHSDYLTHLDLTNIPTKQNFNRFFKLKVNKQIINLLDTTAERMLAVATQHKCVLDIEIVKKNIRDYKNKAREERKVLNESTKLLKKLIYPQINLKMGNNSRFTTQDLLDILVHVAQTHDFANDGCKTFRDLYEDKEVPDGDTFLYHFKKLNSKEELRITFENITDIILNFAKKNYNLLNKRKLDIAYDIHKIPFYGRNAEYIKDSKYERGTTHFYQFLTCDIVVAGKRFTVDVIPIHPFDDLEDLLDESLHRIKKKIRVDRAFLDRGFANSKCINVLKTHRINFIMPIQRNDKIKQWMDKSENCEARLVENFEVNQQSVNLYLVDDEEGIKRSFITNLKVPILLSHYFYQWYSKRWGIESGYRLKAQDFKPRTTSRNYTLRLFYFLFTVMLYNLWVLTNIIVGVKLYGKVPNKPLISAKRFSIILYKIQKFIDPGG